MRVSLFEQYGALNSGPVFQAIRDGFNRLGIQCSSMDKSADVAVIWSQVWAGRMKHNQSVWQEFRSSGRPVIVAEVGMIKRGHTWKLGINGTGLSADWGVGSVDNRSTQLGLTCLPWTNQGKNIIIAVQRNDSEQWARMPPTDIWLNETIATLKKYTDRPIIIRPHPRQKLSNITDCVIDDPQPIPNSYDCFNYPKSLNNAWAVINWNSGTGTQAILAGVPAFVGPLSLAAPVGNLSLDQIENPLRPNRDAWLEDIAHTEWTILEIQSGYPLKRLIDVIDLP